jgi:hypothetical protein
MLKSIVAAVALLAAPVAANAVQVALSPLDIAGSSGFYQGFDFAPGNILNQQTGTVTETFGAGYWLNEDNGPTNAFITIDLDGTYNLTKIRLYNTANGFYGDRGTGSFQIFGGNSITNGVIDSPTLILSGTLSAGTPYIGNNAPSFPVAQDFSVSGSFSYISFNPTSVSTFNNACCGTNVYGLNELKVYAAVPEPQSWMLLIAGFGLVGASMRRRAMRTA